MITLEGSYAGIETIRNISLIHRSISRTLRRIDRGEAASENENTPVDNATVDIATAQRMRTQVGSVTQQIKDLEQNLKRNEAAGKSLSDLKDIAVNLKQVVDNAARDREPTPERSRNYQAQANKLVASFNEALSGAEYAGEKLFSTREARIFRIFQMKNLEVDSPEAAEDAAGKVQSSVRELNDYQAELGNLSQNQYDSAIRKLQVATQNLAAADAGVSDADTARRTADDTAAMIRQSAQMASQAQGHLTSESVFQLLHA